MLASIPVAKICYLNTLVIKKYDLLIKFPFFSKREKLLLGFAKKLKSSRGAQMWFDFEAAIFNFLHVFTTGQCLFVKSSSKHEFGEWSEIFWC